MITATNRAAIRARWNRARMDKRAFWRQSEIASYLNDLEWVLDELDRLEVKLAYGKRQTESVCAD